MTRAASIAMFVLILCLSPAAFAGVATAPQTPARLQSTVKGAVGYLQAQGADWLKTHRCAACHHVAMTIWALSEADRQGYAVDKKFLTDTIDAALGSRQKMIASGLLANPAAPPDPRPLARGVNMGTVFMAVAAESLPALQEGQKQSLRFIADDIVHKQQEDGSWEFFLRRPPLNENQTSDTAWMIMALMGERGSDVPQSHRTSLEKSLAWLSHAPGETYQDKVLKTLIAIRAGEPRERIQTTMDELFSLQRPDGGWSQLASSGSDAFATGQTLYVLILAGCQPNRPEIRRAIDFLISTQAPDGSWPMTSRATPDGRPGGAKLLTPITTAATAWATLGLAEAIPNRSAN